MLIRRRRYGQGPRQVVVLHGGPGAPGYMAPVARELARRGFSVIEPMQRPSSPQGPALTVDQHVADLDALRSELGPQVALVGSSWGAMLALAYAAAHPGRALGLVLIGSGTFGEHSRSVFERRVAERGGPELERALEALELRVEREHLSDDTRKALKADLLFDVYCVDPLTRDLEVIAIDAQANRESWQDMVLRQQRGDYPRAFDAIDVPVLMLHGDDDPHPGEIIRDELLPYLGQLRYVGIPRCGHYPWIEHHGREPFLRELSSWLAALYA